MSLEQIILFFAALCAGVGSGAIHELAGKRWAVTWALMMLWLLIGLYVL